MLRMSCARTRTALIASSRLPKAVAAKLATGWRSGWARGWATTMAQSPEHASSGITRGQVLEGRSGVPAAYRGVLCRTATYCTWVYLKEIGFERTERGFWVSGVGFWGELMDGHVW